MAEKRVESKECRPRKDVADYLERFDKSPYHYPNNEYQNVKRVSKLGGTWEPPAAS
jgi:hypothetical protein